MLRNFLLTSIRNLQRNRKYSAINLIGFSVALSSIFIIVTFIQQEFSMDAELLEKDQTFLVTLKQNSTGGSREVGLSSVETMDWLLQSNSEFVSGIKVRNVGNQYFRNGNVRTSQTALLADPPFFEYFNIKLKHGDPATVLEHPGSVVLSESMALALFGDLNPVGQTIEMYMDFSMPLQVTGVVEDSRNIHLQYDCLINWDSKISNGGSMGEWYKYSIHTYVKTQVAIEPAQLAHDISMRYEEDFPEDNLSFRFYNLEQIYFKTGHVEFMSGFRSGNEESLYVLAGIALLILIIAIVNYVNINISLVIKRLKEIGVRKVMGASKVGLGIQFLCESLILAFVGTLLALTISDLLVRIIPELFDNGVGLISNAAPGNIMFLLGIGIGTGIVSALYPVLFISRIQTSDGLRNQLSSDSSKTQVRNLLLGIQFVITFGLIVLSGIVFRQYQFMSSKDLGYLTEEILLIPIGNSNVLSKQYLAFKDGLLKFPEVSHASVATDGLGQGYTNNSYYAAVEDMIDIKNNGVMTTYYGVDDGFIPTYGIKIAQGRNLNSDLGSDSSAVVINEKLVSKLGLEDPIGKRLKLYGEDSRPMTIVGVVKDFNFQSLHREVNPVAMYFNTRNYWTMAIRFDPRNTDEVLSKAENLWNEFESGVPFEYEFLDQKIARFYEKEAKFNQVIFLFSFLSIALSIIGLFGITAFTIEQRLKEVSIRKVLGAEVYELLMLFNRKVILIFGITLLVSVPLSFILATKWLNNFAYHIDNSFLFYATSAFSILVLLVLTVSFTSLKAAKSNPVNYLRDE